MHDLILPSSLKEKIFQININSKNNSFEIVSYFPLSEDEKQIIASKMSTSFSGSFHSIFSDQISEQNWIKSKSQIIKRFQDELFDID